MDEIWGGETACADFLPDICPRPNHLSALILALDNNGLGEPIIDVCSQTAALVAYLYPCLTIRFPKYGFLSSQNFSTFLHDF